MSVLVLLGPGAAEARFHLQKIADTDTLVPGTAGTFETFRLRPALAAGRVAFQATGAGVDAIFLWDGSLLSILVSNGTPIPGGSGNFLRLLDPSLEANGDIAYKGLDAVEDVGNYKLLSGSDVLVADEATPIPPAGTDLFVQIRDPSLDGSDVSFYGTDWPGTPGIYVEIGGVLSALAGTSTPIPGGSGSFTAFGILTSMDAGEVAFWGSGTGGQAGVYRGTLASLTAVADAGTPIPGGSGSFSAFDIPSLDAGQVAFRGSGAGGQSGIYLHDGQSLERIVDASTPVPGDSGQFANYGLVSLDAGDVAFRATTTSGGIGVYAVLSGRLCRVADLSTPLFGKPLVNLHAGQESLSGQQVVFRAEFVDGSRGVYLATALPDPAIPLLPPPAVGGLGALLLVIACARRLRTEA